MSKKWKIAIGVIVAVIVISGIGLLHLGSMIYWGSGGERGWSTAASIADFVWGPGASEYIPRFGRGLAVYKGETGMLPQFEVRLVDDNGDGIPDRGMIEIPAGLPSGRSFGPGHMLFGPGRGLPFRPAFGPFFIVGGLLRLAFLALLIGLAVVCFHRWNKAKEAREPKCG